MTTVGAAAIGIGFLWSIVLFVLAVVVRNRHQEAGFGYALAGAAVFLITFADRVPGASDSFRNALTFLPGVDRADAAFSSSTIALWLLVVIYLFRMAVFYRLLLASGVDLDADSDSDEDKVNDFVVTFLSYLSLAVCIVAALRGAYDLAAVGTAAVVVALAVIHYVPVLRKLIQIADDLVSATVAFFADLGRVLGIAFMHTLALIARLEQMRRPGDESGRLHEWAERRLGQIEDRRRQGRQHQKAILRRAARRLSGDGDTSPEAV